MQRELLRERTRCKALEEELENPMNIHRWRKLEVRTRYRHGMAVTCVYNHVNVTESCVCVFSRAVIPALMR